MRTSEDRGGRRAARAIPRDPEWASPRRDAEPSLPPRAAEPSVAAGQPSERMKSLPLSLRCLAASLPVAGAFATPLQSDRFATRVVSFHQGTGSGVFVQDNVLGGPRGGGLSMGSFDVLSLGAGGDVTLGFDVTIADGPGADLIVYENPFASGGTVFAEVVHVEVSTDGLTFARFPTRYSGPPGPLGEFQTVPWGSFTHMPGGVPGLAHVDANERDPFDPVESGGDALDLAELRRHPAVVGGQVDLSQIDFVRLVDCVGGSSVDSRGVTIWDSGGPGSADIDAVAVIQHLGNQDPDGPRVDLWLDRHDFAHLVVEDPDGLSDLEPGSLRASVNLVEVPFSQVQAFFWKAKLTPQRLHLVSRVPVTHTAFEVVLAVSVRDLGGGFSADQIALNP